MLSDETITNIVLHRDTRIDSNQVPFVVASTSTLRVSHPRQSISRRTITERIPSSRSSKSAVDAKSRAISDSCMAAAIGDLQWLKQSIRDGPIGNGEITSVEQTYGKEGLAPIHLAALHGRLNCLTYLVETVQTDVNCPSSTGWRPIHLCISKETGSRSYQCLQYLIAHGSTVNIANQDLLTPLHQAASEGHVQCLELLLAHNADVYAEDSRKQLPIDLAKLWGHKKCAKMLAAAMWHQNKHLSAKERLLSRNNKMADLLLEIKREHAVLFEEKAEEKFDQWLINAGTGSAVNSSVNETKPSSSTSQTLPSIGSEAQSKFLESNEKKNIPKRVFPSAYTSLHRWNSSTHVHKNPYIPNLTDVYPRDPFTKMPPKPEAIEIYRLLQKMSVADVKKFLQQRKEKGTKKKKGTRTTDQQRPVVYAACHVDDIQTLHKPRKGEDAFQPLRRFDESGLHLGNNAHKSVFFGQLIEALDDGENSFRVQQQQADEKAKWALFEQYGSELIEFLTDRHGRFKKQFDKVLPHSIDTNRSINNNSMSHYQEQMHPNQRKDSETDIADKRSEISSKGQLSVSSSLIHIESNNNDMHEILTPLERRERIYSLLIIGLISLLTGIDYAVILPTAWGYIKTFMHAHYGGFVMGTLLSVFALSGAIAGIILGYLNDKGVSLKNLILFGIFFKIIGNILYFLGINIYMVVFSRLIAGIGMGLVPPLLAEISRRSTPETRTQLLSKVLACRQIGLLLGPCLTILFKQMNFTLLGISVTMHNSPGLLMAIFWILSAFLTSFLFFDSPTSLKSANGSPNTLETFSFGQAVARAWLTCKKPVIMILLITSFIAYFNQTALETTLTPFTNHQFNWQELQVSILFAVAGIEIVLVYIVLHYITKKFRDQSILLFGYLILSLACLIAVSILPFSEAGSNQYLPFFLLFVALDILALPLIVVTSTSLFTQHINENEQGFGQGIQRFVISLATVVGPLYAGGLLQSIWMMLSIMTLIVLFATFLIIIAYRSFRSKCDEESSSLIRPINSQS